MEVSTSQVILPDLKQWSADQANDHELQKILSGATQSAFKIEPRHIAEGTVYFDISTKDARPFNELQE